MKLYALAVVVPAGEAFFLKKWYDSAKGAISNTVNNMGNAFTGGFTGGAFQPFGSGGIDPVNWALDYSGTSAKVNTAFNLMSGLGGFLRSEDIVGGAFLCGEETVCSGGFVSCIDNSFCQCNEGFRLGGEGDAPEDENKCIPTKECPEGMSVLIDENGNFDGNNIDTCLVDKSGAAVLECNAGQYGGIGQLVVIRKSFFENQPEGWETLDCTEDATEDDQCSEFMQEENYYFRVFQPSEMEKSFDGSNLVYTSTVMIGPVAEETDGVNIYTGAKIEMNFRCNFDLADQNVSGDVEVSGSDMVVNADFKDVTEQTVGRESTGVLEYRMIVEESHYLGQRVGFAIEPLDKGVVHSRAKKCTVALKEGSSELTVFGEENYCRNSFVDFQIGENYGSTAAQDYSYKAFKWSVDSLGDEIEKQTVTCTVELAKNEDGFDDDVNPQYCGEN